MPADAKVNLLDRPNVWRMSGARVHPSTDVENAFDACLCVGEIDR
jgi:hypothetical protein